MSDKEYFEEAILIYKELLKTKKGGTLYYLQKIFKDEQLKTKLLGEVVNEI